MAAPKTRSGKKRLSRLARILHTMGVDVKKHLEDLELEEEVLKKEKEKIGKAKFLSQSEKQKLSKIFTDLLTATAKLEELDEHINRQVIPLTWRSTLSYLPIIGPITKKQLEEARTRVLIPLYLEDKQLFKEYPKLLSTIEKSCRDLANLERNWGKIKGEARNRMFIAHHEIRQALHYDLMELNQDINELYTMRLKIYDKLIRSSRRVAPKLTSALEKDRDFIVKAGYTYSHLNHKHQTNLSSIYTEEK